MRFSKNSKKWVEVVQNCHCLLYDNVLSTYSNIAKSFLHLKP